MCVRTREKWEALLVQALSGLVGLPATDIDLAALDSSIFGLGGTALSLITKSTLSRPKLHADAVSVDVDTENGHETVQAQLAPDGLVFLWPIRLAGSAT
jgi:hypothetical protein